MPLLLRRRPWKRRTSCCCCCCPVRHPMRLWILGDGLGGTWCGTNVVVVIDAVVVMSLVPSEHRDCRHDQDGGRCRHLQSYCPPQR